ncbi:hypothetical protein [Streptomyces blattellae]|uniref:hypothetical protein n=1 Tax=Streptomyces blattellae TaxID=2569855 RepID=UPI0012B77AE5|nr:hypothetical protein [Streptomyces blattellae]
MLMGSTLRRGGLAADPVAEFMQVVQRVLATAEETCGAEELEPGLERALAILQGNPELRGQFESRLIALIDSPQEGVVEIVSFLMHVLRWEAVREAVEERIRHPRGDVSHLRLHEAMLDAFSDSWRDRDLFTRFSGA